MIRTVEITVAPGNRLPHGTVRRSPGPGFAHAILLDQFDREQCWQVIDVYGPMDIETDEDMQGWPIVYIPVPDEVWDEITPPIPIPGISGRPSPLLEQRMVAESQVKPGGLMTRRGPVIRSGEYIEPVDEQDEQEGRGKQ